MSELIGSISSQDEIKMKSINASCRKCYGNDQSSEIILKVITPETPNEERYFDKSGTYHHHTDFETGTWKCENGHSGEFLFVEHCGPNCLNPACKLARFVMTYNDK